MIKNPILRLLTYGPAHLTKFILKGYFDNPRTLMIEISGKCNLDCPLCHWKGRAKGIELSDEEWESRIKELLTIYPGITRAIWIGGEPLLRPKLIKKLSKYFLFNIVVTNGTKPFFKAKRVIFCISVDGTESYHTKSRDGRYAVIKKNIEKANRGVVINCLVSKINAGNIENFIKEWTNERKVNKIQFTFFTSLGDKDKENNWWSNFTERDRVITKLDALAKKYPRELKRSVAEIKAFKDLGYQKAGELCRKHPPLYIDSGGKKIRCPHPDAECNKCGHCCVIRSAYRHKKRLNVINGFFYDCKRFLKS